MRTARTTLAACALALLALPATTATAAAPAASNTATAHGGGQGRDLGRQVLGARDGWAAAEGGTTGGAAADAAHDVTVRTWPELRAALGGDAARGDTTPRIVRVVGTITASTAADGRTLTCDDYADPAYTHEAYRAAYDPATWGEAEPTGPLEDARQRSVENQTAQIRQYIGSNVTLVGVGRDARIVGANLVVRGSDNVIVRNLRISDAYDCFPFWDPTDAGGTWNSEYDNLWIAESTHVWVDHNTFDDGDNPPSALPEVFGAKFEVHDGLLDITNGSDLVTASWNVFREHDKVMLIGNSNSRIADRGKLRTTLHHNLFDRTGQRTPRVRFGQVHVYDNWFVNTDAALFSYNLGAGVESQIIAQNNAFTLAPGINPATIVKGWGGTQLREEGSVVIRDGKAECVDLVAAYNATPDADLADTASWTPQYVQGPVHPARAVPNVVRNGAGSGQLR